MTITRALGDSAGWHIAQKPRSKFESRSVQPRPPPVIATMMSSGKHIDIKSKWRRRKTTKINSDEDNDCASLAWLLNFRLDEIVNVKVPDDEPQKIEEPKVAVVEPQLVSRKPPYTYPELIERSLRENGELTVSGIYQWISDRFPYYKAHDERWKNSVRHNLSINPHFRKGTRAPQGAGHLWSLAANAIDLLPVRNPIQTDDVIAIEEAQIIDCPKVIVLDEAAIAAASIINDQDYFSGGTMFLNPVSTEQVIRECGLITVD